MSINHLQTPAQPANTNPMTFPSYTAPVAAPVAPVPVQPRSNMVWVQGMEAAKSYSQGPNTTVSLWDTENQCVYIRTTDINGFPRPLTVIDYTIRNETQESVPDTSDFVTKTEFNELKDMISDLKESLSAQQQKQPQQKAYHGKPKGGRDNEK